MSAQPEFTTLPLDAIRASAFNPRKSFDDAATADLAASIVEQGVLQPILVRPLPAPKNLVAKKGAKQTYEIVAGERRWRAAKLAGLKEIPARILDVDDAAAEDARLIENDQRADITPHERGQAYQRRLDAGLSIEDLAERIGRSVGVVRSFLRLARAPAILLEALAKEVIPFSTAEIVCRVPSERMRLLVACHVLAGSHWDPTLTEQETRASMEDRESGRYQPEPVLTYRETKDLIAQRCTVELSKRAQFPLKLAGLANTPSCHECPKRAGNDPDMKSEKIRADICTDPECFGEKVRAWGEKLTEEASTKGQVVLPAAECEKIFQAGSLRYTAPFVDANEPCYQDLKQRTYGELLPALKPQAVLAVEPQYGRVFHLLDRTAAAAAMKKEHKILISGHGEGGPGPGKAKPKSGPTAEDAKRLAEQKLEREVEREMLRRAKGAAEKLFAGIKTEGLGDGITLLRAIAANQATKIWGDHFDEFVKVNGIEGKGKLPRLSAVRARLDTLDAPQVLALAAQALVAQIAFGWHDEPDKAPLLRALGIADQKAIAAEVKARLEGAKAEPAPSAARTTSLPPRAVLLDRGAPLVDLLDLDNDVEVVKDAEDALAAAGLRTVGDLLDAAAKVKGYNESRHYQVLRGVPGLNVAMANEIADAIVDSGILSQPVPVPIPIPTPTKGKKAKP